MNIRKTWMSGINGDGVTICINDPSGVSYTHPELRPRFVSGISLILRMLVSLSLFINVIITHVFTPLVK